MVQYLHLRAEPSNHYNGARRSDDHRNGTLPKQMGIGGDNVSANFQSLCRCLQTIALQEKGDNDKRKNDLVLCEFPK